MSFDNSNISLQDIEKLEHKYLMKYWFFLKFVEDEIVRDRMSMEDIRGNWNGLYGGDKKGISEFDVGCERIVYALLNGKIAGRPNSCPVSADLFFEVDDAFIHIDLKSVTTKGVRGDNIGDFNTSVAIEKNQNSYKGTIIVNARRKNETKRKYSPNLPTFYTKSNGDKKLTLTYFVSMLNNSVTKGCELISIMCMPNGKLQKHYKSSPLKAGKNKGEVRYNFSNTPKFDKLDGNKKRVRIIYKNPNMSEYVAQKLSFYLSNFDPHIDE